MGLMCYFSRKNIILWTNFWEDSFLRMVNGEKTRIDTEEITFADGDWFVLVHIRVLLAVVSSIDSLWCDANCCE
jgi:hypothetical protein